MIAALRDSCDNATSFASYSGGHTVSAADYPIPRLLLDTRVPMRDGVELSADIYLPREQTGPVPAVLVRTPYDNTAQAWLDIATVLAGNGYAVVLQDVRGRGDSDGSWEPFINEGSDGYDSIEWVAAQSWCDGKVGMMGGSYLGYVQWIAARELPPHLTAMVSTAAAGRWMEEAPFNAGIFTSYWMWWLNLVGGRTMQQGVLAKPRIPSWPEIFTHRPLRDADLALGRTNTVWRKWLEHSTFDDYWKSISLRGHFQHIDLPVMHITGWFDGDQWGELFLWNGMIDESPAAEKQWLVSGPWDHAGTRVPKDSLGGREFGPTAIVDMLTIHLRFFERWLKGVENGQDADPKVRIFAMGENEWRDHEVWPPAGTTATPFFLHSGGRANTIAGDGRVTTSAPAGSEIPADTYRYDPNDPTPSVPDVSTLPFGDSTLDNRWKLDREDTLVYTSEPLAEDLEITGHPRAVLFATSDCIDTDWHLSLCDVAPDGRSDVITSAALRAAYREGIDAQPSSIEPHQVYEYHLEFMATSNVWKAGHQLRITIASADFPSSSRNPNTNAPIGHDEISVVAQNSIIHTPEHPSRLLLPVVPSK
ncbi:CocE/NonD family hydrolase [soil metagenome]